jgi:hypothetical protein
LNFLIVVWFPFTELPLILQMLAVIATWT